MMAREHRAPRAPGEVAPADPRSGSAATVASMVSAGTAPDGHGAGEAPWPVLAETCRATGRGGACEGGRGSADRCSGSSRCSASWRSSRPPGSPSGARSQPSSPARRRRSAATTTPPPVVHRVTIKWGPLTVRAVREAPVGAAERRGRGRRVDARGDRRHGQRARAGRADWAAGSSPWPGSRDRGPPRRRSRSAGRSTSSGGEQGGKPADDLLRIDLATGRGRTVAKFEEPLAEAGVATKGGAVYLAGGWTGEKYATAVLRFTPPDKVELVARLPDGVRSPAVVRLGHTLYVAGGRTSRGLSRGVYAVDLSSGAVTRLGLLPKGGRGSAARLVRHGALPARRNRRLGEGLGRGRPDRPRHGSARPPRARCRKRSPAPPR